MTLKDYRIMHDNLRKEVEDKKIFISKKNQSTGRFERVNITNVLIGQINKGLYGRTQRDIITDLKNRQKGIILPSDSPILNVSDEVHYAYRIVVFRNILTEMDRCDINRKPAQEWLEIAFDKSVAMKDHFKRYAQKNYTLYQDLLSIIQGDKYSKSAKHLEQKQVILKSLSDIGRIKNSRFEKGPDFEICEIRSSVSNILVGSIPKQAKVKRETFNGQMNIFDYMPNDDQIIRDRDRK